MQAEGVFITVEEIKDAELVLPKIARLAKKVHNAETIGIMLRTKPTLRTPNYSAL
ncbi:uncharacterized protein FOMMEDRAFT_150532 [Fomitiporia mediterranea MF3/22]|uniref:uncharacterized protein n=1 Tax=Fomitiporia mediterranea (strain MF3/22) TaxID=694068 RepID=UPI0004408834|nr:uncharacterized protein FOMMEDRAFT_150532 [Fomitiporia mediterranea MF3/22]EJD07936.1 hypothetical protein FOMMEDRAFT_150532 [Fomitiporia mediterranea MF3/22]